MSDRSPFETNRYITMYLEPVLNNYYKTYEKIITLSALPEGPLANMVSYINTPYLSEFHDVNPTTASESFRCKYVLLRYPKTNLRGSIKTGRNYMFAEDVPNIYGYLESNGYKIVDPPRFGKFLFDRKDTYGREMVCMFSGHQE